MADLLSENRELLRRFRHGEAAALSEVYTHYAPVIARFLRDGFGFRSGQNTCAFRGYKQQFDLENALQEVFLRAFSERGRLSYDGLRCYKNYLCAIAKNYVIDQTRQQKDIRGLVELDEETTASGDNSGARESPLQSAEAKELDSLLAEYLEQCDARTRRYFELRYRYGLVQTDVVRQMSLSRIQVSRL